MFNDQIVLIFLIRSPESYAGRKRRLNGLGDLVDGVLPYLDCVERWA